MSDRHTLLANQMSRVLGKSQGHVTRVHMEYIVLFYTVPGRGRDTSFVVTKLDILKRGEGRVWFIDLVWEDEDISFL